MTLPEPLRVFSYGGGVQSTAALVLAASGAIDFKTFLFANVGDDSEHPATLDYVREIATPWAKERGIEVIELHRHTRDGQPETLYGRLTRPDTRSINIPVYFSGGVPGTRNCTADFKVRVIAKWLKAHGATKENPAIVGIGISTDEIQRAKQGIDARNPIQDRTYPLLDLGMSRQACLALIEAVGLPEPRKSACYFCPYHKTSEWRRMKRDEPDLFERAAALEDVLNEKRERIGKDGVTLTPSGLPLRKAISPDGDQLGMDFGAGDCESGYCMT